MSNSEEGKKEIQDQDQLSIFDTTQNFSISTHRSAGILKISSALNLRQQKALILFLFALN